MTDKLREAQRHAYDAYRTLIEAETLDERTVRSAVNDLHQLVQVVANATVTLRLTRRRRAASMTLQAASLVYQSLLRGDREMAARHAELALIDLMRADHR